MIEYKGGEIDNKQTEIFMFPNAGGTIEIFKSVSLSISGRVFRYEYAGHGKRIHEAFCTSIDDNMEDVLHFFLRNHDPKSDYVLFGYSMGALIVMELLNIIVGLQIKMPIKIIIAAEPPRNTLFINPHISEEENMKRFYITMGEIPEKTINSKVFQELYFASFINDYRIIREYDYSRIKGKYDVLCCILYSEADTPLSIMLEWKEFFDSPPIFYEFYGGHFFIKKNAKEIAELICT